MDPSIYLCGAMTFAPKHRGEILRKYFASYLELVQFFEAIDHVLFEFCEFFDS
jgi:hypothetical protein